VELGLVPLGSLGLGIFALMLYVAHTSLAAAAVIHALLGVAAGFFIVPLDAYLQLKAAPSERGRIIAASNFLAFAGVILGSGWIAVTGGLLGWSPATVVLATGLLTIAATIYILRLLPDFMVRLLLWLLTHTLYRITVRGARHLPKEGGALLVCNHISFVDAFLVGACTQRFVRFLMYRPIYEARGVHWFAKLMGCIPVSEKDGRKGVTASLAGARDRLLQGELLCIFAEGSISRTGNLLRFRKGFEAIAGDTGAPVIPVHLDGVWGSVFSYQGGRFFWKWPRRIPYPVTISIGEPMPSGARAWQVRQAVMKLSSEAFEQRKAGQRPLHVGFVRTARRFPGRFCMADSSGLSLSFRRALAGSLALSRRLRGVLVPEEEMVGLLLPPSVPAALLNVACMMAGRVPVNLNYTTSQEGLRSAVARCGIRTIVTSEKLLEKSGLPRGDGMVMVEDLAGGSGAGTKLLWLAAAALPSRAIAALWAAPCGMDDLATVIFSSGSTAEPKGVMLTHHNIVSNVEGMQQIFDITREDRMIGVLPFFHSFGFTATLWLPLSNGFGVVYHSNPLDAKMVGRLCEKHRVSFLLATPTFLSGYLKRCTKEQFAHLRYVVVGAEKLKESLANAFRDRFGIEPLEGYGATELSPAATMSLPHVEEPGVSQVGHKAGSIGQPLPGVAARIVDPDTFADRPAGEEGLLLIRGANVMKGYLDDPDRTAAVMHDGWYVTGDIARFDQDGFITLTDRLSRFAKIAGEMIPLGAVEDALHEAAGADEQRFVVAAIPDADRGERLVVLHTCDDLDPAPLTAKMGETGLSRLWIPARDAFYHVETIPLLG
ncbi:MAG TPA: AMP-binding protein, partial [Candidatus Polarisedimenticolia bacterium]|nr:AMP-binding protein [Candidatus Polarisedimenticolia bacterium]